MAPPTLDTLPAEILFQIFSYTSPYSARNVSNHPLMCTAATSVHICNLVEEYCCSLLRIHNVKIPKAPKGGVFVCRKKWFTWIKTHCAMCSTLSKRKAILDSSMTCCKSCDNKEFPKMTQTTAIKEHGLSKLDLFTPSVLHLDLPPLTLGAYVVMGGEALMISKSSVLERKAYIRSLLDPEVRDDAVYLRRRAAAHDRIISRMYLQLEVGDCRARWVRIDPCTSTLSNEVRFNYARQNLEKQWAAMGMDDYEVLWKRAIRLGKYEDEEANEGGIGGNELDQIDEFDVAYGSTSA